MASPISALQSVPREHERVISREKPHHIVPKLKVKMSSFFLIACVDYRTLQKTPLHMHFICSSVAVVLVHKDFILSVHASMTPL